MTRAYLQYLTHVLIRQYLRKVCYLYVTKIDL